MLPGVHVKLRFASSKKGDDNFAVPAEDDCLVASVDTSFESGDVDSWIVEVLRKLPGKSLEVEYGTRPPEHMAGHCDCLSLLAVVFGLHAHERHDEGACVDEVAKRVRGDSTSRGDILRRFLC